MSSLSQAAPRHFTVGVEDIVYYPHYAFGGKQDSYAESLLDLFARHHGMHFEYIPMPIHRLNKMYEQTDIDFKYPSHPNWTPDAMHAKHIHYSQPVVHILGATFVKPERLGLGLKQFSALGIVRGFTPFHWGNQLAAGNIKVLEAPTVHGLIRHVLSGHVDGIDMDSNVLRYHLRNLNIAQDRVVLDMSLPHAYVGFHLSTLNHPDVIAQLDTFLDTHVKEVMALKARYQIEDVHPPQPES